MKKKNMSRYIHVKIGLTDAVYPVLELITTGPFNGFYHYSTSPTTTAWTHKQWCTPCAADGTPIADTERQDTDWRKFLRDHWNTERNHCKVEHLDEFYRIFRCASDAYFNNKQHHEKDKDNCNHQHGVHEPRRTDTVHDTSGRRRPAPSMPTGDKKEVRETGKQMKPVQYAAAEQQPKKKLRYVELSLFDLINKNKTL